MEYLPCIILILMAATACTLNLICARKKNIIRDKQSFFYRMRIPIGIFTFFLGIAAVALLFPLKLTRYNPHDILSTAFVINVILGITTVITSFAIMSVYLWTLQEKTRNKIEVLYRRKINLGIPVNIYRELVTIIECRK